MKLRLITIIEIIIGVIFCVTFILKKENIGDVGWLVFFSSFILMILYFPLGFYTLKSKEYVEILNRIFYGMLFSCSVISIAASAGGKIDISFLLLMIFSSMFVIVAGWRSFAVYMFELPQILNFDNGIVIRYLVLLALMLYSMLTYKFPHL